MTRPSTPYGLFRGSYAISEGDLTTRQLASNAYRRLFRDVYLDDDDAQVTYLMRCHGAAMIAPSEAILTGRSAAAVRGLTLCQTYDPIEFTVKEKHSFGPLQGIRVRRARVPILSDEHEPWQGIRIASPRRMALDTLLFHAPRTRSYERRLRNAVADVDQILRSGLVDLRDLSAIVNGRRDQGIVLARHAISLADGRAESRPESEVRVVLALNGIPAEPQYEVIHDGCFLGRLDLAYPETQVAVEYDGRWHDEPAQVRLDRIRRDRLRALGWRFVILKADDLRDTSAMLAQKVRAMLRSVPSRRASK